jgi:hypothetical protein
LLDRVLAGLVLLPALCCAALRYYQRLWVDSDRVLAGPSLFDDFVGRKPLSLSVLPMLVPLSTDLQGRGGKQEVFAARLVLPLAPTLIVILLVAVRSCGHR